MKETRFKQTEIGLIPEDWEVVTISKIAETSSGGTPSRSINRYYNGNIRWITTSELKDSRIYDSIEHITEEAVQNSSAKMFPKGTVLMAMYGATIGKLGILEVCSTTNQACCAIICRDIKNIYLFYYLFFIRKEIILQGCGAGQPNISQNIVKNINIGLPKEIEQKKIASALTSIDNLLLSLDKLIEKKRLIKQGAMQELLMGKKRLPGFTGEWVERRLGEIGVLAMCKRVFQEETSEKGDIPFYKIGTFGRKADAYISVNKYEQLKQMYRFPKKGDILISAAGTIGRTVVYDGKPAYFQDSNIIWLDHNEKQIINSFLFFIYQVIKWNTENTTIARLYNDNFNSMTIRFPLSVEEQQAIASALTSMDKEIESLESKKAKYEHIKQGMMQQLLTGKIRLIS